MSDTPHTIAVGQDRIAILHTIGARVIAERHDRSLLVGEIVQTFGATVTIVPVGTRRRVRVLMSRIRKVSVMQSVPHAVYAAICERQRTGERFKWTDVQAKAPKRARDDE